MKPITACEEVLGAWLVYKTEIPDYKAKPEKLVFNTQGQFCWSYGDAIKEFEYRVGAGWMEYRGKAKEWIRLNIWKDNECIVMQPSHGHKTWAKRID